eukprot:4633859-Prymnesium_polylepis.1
MFSRVVIVRATAECAMAALSHSPRPNSKLHKQRRRPTGNDGSGLCTGKPPGGAVARARAQPSAE